MSIKPYNKAHHSLPLVGGTANRFAARRPCAWRYVQLSEANGYR